MPWKPAHFHYPYGWLSEKKYLILQKKRDIGILNISEEGKGNNEQKTVCLSIWYINIFACLLSLRDLKDIMSIQAFIALHIFRVFMLVLLLYLFLLFFYFGWYSILNWTLWFTSNQHNYLMLKNKLSMQKLLWLNICFFS